MTSREGVENHGQPEIRGVPEGCGDRQLQRGRTRAGLHAGRHELSGELAGEGAGHHPAGARLRRRAAHRRGRGPGPARPGRLQRRAPAACPCGRPAPPRGRQRARGHLHQHGHPMAPRHRQGVRAPAPLSRARPRLHRRPGRAPEEAVWRGDYDVGFAVLPVKRNLRTVHLARDPLLWPWRPTIRWQERPSPHPPCPPSPTSGWRVVRRPRWTRSSVPTAPSRG